jgi:hypothetical protein
LQPERQLCFSAPASHENREISGVKSGKGGSAAASANDVAVSWRRENGENLELRRRRGGEVNRLGEAKIK